MNKRFNRGDKPERGGDKSRFSGKKSNDRRDSDKKPRSNERFGKEDSRSERSYSGPKRNSSDRGDKKSFGRDKKPFQKGNSRFNKEDGGFDGDRRVFDRGNKRFSKNDRGGDRDFKKDGEGFERKKRPFNKDEKRFSRDDKGGKGFRKKEGGFSGRKGNFRNDDKRFSKDDRGNKRDFRREDSRNSDQDSSGEKRRPRTRKFMEKDQEMLGDWRRERPESEWHKKADKSHEIKTITEEIRLNKYLANSGLCSRRDADEYIENGAVTVNGEVTTELGVRVQPGDEVRFKGRLILPEKPVYILMNKPKDTITSSDDPEGRRTVLDIIGDHIPQRIFPVGRLDRNTTGVLLLTNDGDLAQKLTHPSYGVHKIYKAELNKPMTKEDMDKLSEGVELEDGFIKPDEVAYVDESRQVIGVEIHSGKNHIVHRMFNSLGYLVDKLDRVAFAGLSKDGLKRGDIRHLTEKEMLTLRKESGKKK